MTWPMHLPRPTVANVERITNPSTVQNLQWQTWRKPIGVSMLCMLLIGGGGGGGGGFTGIAGSARGGGGAGGSSSITRVLVPAIYLPDTLYIQVGAGGQGVGSGGGTAGSGVRSYVCIAPNVDPSNVLAVSSTAVVPTGGGTGTGAAAGAAGGAGTLAAIADMPLAGYGFFFTVGGDAGVAGGAQTGAVGPAQGITVTGCLTTGGSGGAGTTSADFAGGAWTAIANSLLSENRPATPGAGSFDGSGGYLLEEPFFSFGGTGGSSSNTGPGGNGGNGGPGSGGGGGGGGTTGGRGGDGGNGIIIMASW